MQHDAQIAADLRRDIAQHHSVDDAKGVIGNKQERAAARDSVELALIELDSDIGFTQRAAKKVSDAKRRLLKPVVGLFDFVAAEQNF